MGLFRRRERKLAGDVRLALLQVPGSAISSEEEFEARVQLRSARALAAEMVVSTPEVAEAAGAIDGAYIEWDGPVQLVPLICCALYDKLLTNLVALPDMAAELIGQVGEFADRSLRGDPSLEAALSATLEEIEIDDDLRQALSVPPPKPPPFADILPLVGLGAGLAELRDQLGGDGPEQDEVLEGALLDAIDNPVAQVQVEIAFFPSQQRLAAATHFAPLEAMNERVAELSFWAIWDWVCISLLPVANPERAFDALLSALALQTARYQEHGLPEIMDLGRASFDAAIDAGLAPDV